MDIETIEKLTTGDKVVVITTEVLRVPNPQTKARVPICKTDEIGKAIFLQCRPGGHPAIALADSGDVHHIRSEHVFLSREDARNAVVGAIDARMAELTVRRQQWLAAVRDTSEKAK